MVAGAGTVKHGLGHPRRWLRRWRNSDGVDFLLSAQSVKFDGGGVVFFNKVQNSCSREDGGERGDRGEDGGERGEGTPPPEEPSKKTSKAKTAPVEAPAPVLE